MRKIKKIFIALVSVLVLFVLIFCCKTALISSKQIKVEPINKFNVNKELVSKHLSDAVGFKTVSYLEPSKFDYNEFYNFHKYLDQAFPKVSANLKKEVVDKASLLYTWKGSDDSLEPIILMAHMDVVPVEQGTENDWTYPAFSGKIADGFIWGRGSMDCKGQLMGILEAVEYLLSENYQPKRTIYLAFGHDEEVAGPNGSRNIASLLKSRGVKAEYILDEGGAIVKDTIMGVDKPVALIGTEEKGFLSVEFTAKSNGGHSAFPPKQTAIGILSSAISKLENAKFPSKLEGSTKEMLETLAPEMKFPYRMVFSNLWMTQGIVKNIMSSSPSNDASIRTTIAPTMFNSGIKDNVLPTSAKAVVNFRILPGENTESTLSYISKTINDSRISIEPIEESESEPVLGSDLNSEGYTTICKTIKQVYPETITAPYLITGSTDSKYYTGLSKNIFRFSPIVEEPSDFVRPHGTNERISVDGYEQLIQYYIQTIQNSNDNN